ncbi:MAG: polyphosphate kinase 2 [Hyphomonas oceanitis]|nr:polyphosphate kinase 2 [Hyphomonas sp.]
MMKDRSPMPRDDKKEAGRSKKVYKHDLRELQIELVKIQRRAIAHNHRILIIFEGRDAAGKDGIIKRITEHLSPRETRVVALGKPSDRDTRSWYFQRYASHLPADGEIVLFNRSWYNRAGVERVMGFASDDQVEAFYDNVGAFEKMLVGDGTQILKYYLDISKPEQSRRLADRDKDPLKQWKKSPIDAVALEKWDDYTAARDDMLRRTDFTHAPWFAVHTDDKRQARLNTIRHIIKSIDCPETDKALAVPDETIVLQATKKTIAALHR